MITVEVVLKTGRVAHGYEPTDSPVMTVAKNINDYMARQPLGSLMFELQDEGGTMIVPVSEISTITFKDHIV